MLCSHAYTQFHGLLRAAQGSGHTSLNDVSSNNGVHISVLSDTSSGTIHARSKHCCRQRADDSAVNSIMLYIEARGFEVDPCLTHYISCDIQHASPNGSCLPPSSMKAALHVCCRCMSHDVARLPGKQGVTSQVLITGIESDWHACTAINA